MVQTQDFTLPWFICYNVLSDGKSPGRQSGAFLWTYAPRGERRSLLGSHNDELIADSLSLVNVLRQALQKEPLAELPDAVTGNASDCLFYRAFRDIDVRGVSGATVTFGSDRIASLAAELWNTSSHGESVQAPRQLTEVVGLFDSHEFRHYEA